MIECDTAPELATFDVNKFLRKTFSDYNVSDRIDIRDGRSAEAARPVHLEGNGRGDWSADTGGVGNRQRRANSVPSDRIGRNGEGSSESDADTRPEMGEGRRARPKANGRRKLCAYCGQSTVGRSSANSSRNLYCASCTSFFTRYSPSELQRRIAYEEMTQPSTETCSTGPPASSQTCDTNETAPLLPSDIAWNKVTLVSGNNTNGDENHPIEYDEQQRDQSSDAVPHRYARNIRQHGRSPLFNAKPSYRRQYTRQGNVHLRENNSVTKMSDVGQWRNETCGSRRSSCTSASSLNRPTCRICHLHGEPGDTLIAPCRCAGTMQYVHTSCLVHWLEISTKKVLPSPQCELCGYYYRTHHCYKFRRVHAPSCSSGDRVLHIVCATMMLMMIGCAVLSAVYLKQDKGTSYKRASLNADDIIVIASALLFFCAFFVAVFTQYRAETSVCRLCLRFWMINRHWRVKDYDRNLDYDRRNKRGGQSPVLAEQV